MLDAHRAPNDIVISASTPKVQCCIWVLLHLFFDNVALVEVKRGIAHNVLGVCRLILEREVVDRKLVCGSPKVAGNAWHCIVAM